MAHRRKSTLPVCKQKRISSVVDRVLAAKLKENEEPQKLFHDSTSEDGDKSSYDGGRDTFVSRDKIDDTNGYAKVLSDDELDIPTDLMSQFQALKRATKMDSASLMRRMMQDYSQHSGCDKPTSGSRLSSQLFDVSIKRSEGPRERPAEPVYRPRSPGEVIRGENRQRQYESHSREHVSKPVEVQRNPSPARTYSAEQYYWEEETFGTHYNRGMISSNGFRSSMKVPTVVRDSDSSSECFTPGSRPLSRQNMISPLGSETSARVAIPPEAQSMEYRYTNTPEPDGNGHTSPRPNHENGSIASTIPLVASLCDENGVILSPKQESNELQNMDPKLEDFTQEIMSQADAHMAMQALNPHGVAAKLQKACSKNSTKKGQMKLIAENTSHHGVYTSVLKLPWSRRTRTPKNDPGKTQERMNKRKVAGDENIDDLVQDGQLPQLPVKPESMDEMLDPDAAQQLQQPLMLVPVSGIPSSQNGIFVPATSLPMSTETQPNPPMMMVYPNASFANVGRPARKRGRPPKVPVLTRMLSDTSKVPRFDFPVTNFFPQFTQCPQPAIVLNVNNMMNTGSVGNATNNSNANVNVSSATNVVENNVTQNEEKEEVASQQQKEDILTPPVVTMSSETISLDVPVQATILNMNEKENENEAAVNEQHLTGSVLSKTMTTTTSIANTQSGAIYQEMILSSKSLVNVRPRKRQSTTDMLKAKSTPTNDFICTSFKLRNVNKPDKEKKKMPWVPGMKRRGRPPKKKIYDMIEGQSDSLIHGQYLPATIHHYPSDVNNGIQRSVQSPEMFCQFQPGPMVLPQISPNGCDTLNEPQVNENDLNASVSTDGSTTNDEQAEEDKDENGKDIFQQLFHCKVCNEVVPVEKQEEHREKHIQIKFVCNVCEKVTPSYAYRDDVEKDKNIKELFQCKECELADDAKDESLSVSLLCNHCSERFGEFSALSAHKQSTHQNASVNKEFECPECDKSFLNYQKLKLHQQLCHVTRYHACPFQNCQKVYTSPEKLQSHIKNRHENRLHLRCIYDGCQEKFFTHASLKEHIQNKHYSVKGYTCSKPGCDEEFSSERELKFHLLLHNDSDMCTFECEICDYRCHQQSVLDWHVKNLHPETQTEQLK